MVALAPQLPPPVTRIGFLIAVWEFRRQPLGPWAMSPSHRKRSRWIAYHGWVPVADRNRHRRFPMICGPYDLWSPEPAGPARHGAMAKGREPEDDTFLHWSAANGYREIIGGLPPSQITLGKLAQTRDHTAAGHRCAARPATSISIRWQRHTSRHS